MIFSHLADSLSVGVTKEPQWFPAETMHRCSDYDNDNAYYQLFLTRH
jgi:hypothetical protein